MLASELYAHIHSKRQSGLERCRWCGGACGHDWLADDHGDGRLLAACPSEPWACIGCIEWRRPRRTVRFLDRSFLDNRRAEDWSWLLLPDEGAFAIRPRDSDLLWPILLAPPPTFALLMRHSMPNRLHLGVVNENPTVTQNTSLRWTMDGVRMTWTPYELEKALRLGTDGREPGVRVLVELLGPFRKLAEEKNEWRSYDSHPEYERKGGKGGKPPPLPDGKMLKELVVSGACLKK